MLLQYLMLPLQINAKICEMVSIFQHNIYWNLNLYCHNDINMLWKPIYILSVHFVRRFWNLTILARKM